MTLLTSWNSPHTARKKKGDGLDIGIFNQSPVAKTDRGNFRLDENRGRLSQDALHRTGANADGGILRGRGVQPDADRAVETARYGGSKSRDGVREQRLGAPQAPETPQNGATGLTGRLETGDNRT